MFAQRLFIELEEDGRCRPCPVAWLDQFFMRHFTGISALDDTLPVADGRLEAGLDVDLDVLHREFEKWLRGRKMIVPGGRVRITQS